LLAGADGAFCAEFDPAQKVPPLNEILCKAAACESAFRPAGTLETAYSNNPRDAIENISTPTR
jgi:hypothetical protein